MSNSGVLYQHQNKEEAKKTDTLSRNCVEYIKGQLKSHDLENTGLLAPDSLLSIATGAAKIMESGSGVFKFCPMGPSYRINDIHDEIVAQVIASLDTIHTLFIEGTCIPSFETANQIVSSKTINTIYFGTNESGRDSEGFAQAVASASNIHTIDWGPSIPDTPDADLAFAQTLASANSIRHLTLGACKYGPQILNMFINSVPISNLQTIGFKYSQNIPENDAQAIEKILTEHNYHLREEILSIICDTVPVCSALQDLIGEYVDFPIDWGAV